MIPKKTTRSVFLTTRNTKFMTKTMTLSFFIFYGRFFMQSKELPKLCYYNIHPSGFNASSFFSCSLSRFFFWFLIHLSWKIILISNYDARRKIVYGVCSSGREDIKFLLIVTFWWNFLVFKEIHGDCVMQMHPYSNDVTFFWLNYGFYELCDGVVVDECEQRKGKDELL